MCGSRTSASQHVVLILTSTPFLILTLVCEYTFELHLISWSSEEDLISLMNESIITEMPFVVVCCVCFTKQISLHFVWFGHVGLFPNIQSIHSKKNKIKKYLVQHTAFSFLLVCVIYVFFLKYVFKKSLCSWLN